MSGPSGSVASQSCRPSRSRIRDASASVAAGAPSRTFCAIVASNRNGSCGTITTRPARSPSRDSGTPERQIRPDAGGRRRVSSLAKLDLPEPVRPTTATCSPGSIRSDTSCRTSGPPAYRAETRSSRTPTGPGGSGTPPATRAGGVVTSSSARRQPVRAFCASPRLWTTNCSGRTKNVTRNTAATTSPDDSLPHHTPPSSTVTVIVEIASSPSEALECNGTWVPIRLSRERSTASSSFARVRACVPVARISGPPRTDSATVLCSADRSRRARSKRRAMTRCVRVIAATSTAVISRTGTASCQPYTSRIPVAMSSWAPLVRNWMPPPCRNVVTWSRSPVSRVTRSALGTRSATGAAMSCTRRSPSRRRPASADSTRPCSRRLSSSDDTPASSTAPAPAAMAGPTVPGAIPESITCCTVSGAMIRPAPASSASRTVSPSP